GVRLPPGSAGPARAGKRPRESGGCLLATPEPLLGIRPRVAFGVCPRVRGSTELELRRALGSSQTPEADRRRLLVTGAVRGRLLACAAAVTPGQLLRGQLDVPHERQFVCRSADRVPVVA